jgi:hypothetical protein
MNKPINFDTHRFVKRLVETGMSERTAEVLAEEQVDLLNSNLATKEQLAATEARLLKWMIGLFMGYATLMLSAVNYF